VRTGAPVTSQTLFSIASITKSVTAAGLGVLHDDGALSWTTPVRTLLPSFAMKSRWATRKATVVDFLTHRTGLPDHAMLAFATSYSRDEIVRRLRHLAPSAAFRSTVQYSDLSYLVAGHLAGEIDGRGWGPLVRQRLLEPLDMTGATLTIDVMMRPGDYARPYGGGPDTVRAEAFPHVDAAAPAGAINASAADMTNWVQLFLNDGRHDGAQVLDSTTVAQLIRPRVVMPDPRPYMPGRAPVLQYALGWFVERRGGERVVWHSGGLPGYSAVAGLLPGREVGWVILTNKGNTPVPSLLMYELIERVQGRDGRDWPRRVAAAHARQQASTRPHSPPDSLPRDAAAGAGPVHPRADYVGTYTHPGYGRFTVSQAGARLIGRYGALRDTLRHHHNDVFSLRPEPLDRAFRVQFQTALDGTVDAVAIPLEPAVDPVVFTREP
jgi:CubicO group peptidase (beta-lactamase class C family)